MVAVGLSVPVIQQGCAELQEPQTAAQAFQSVCLAALSVEAERRGGGLSEAGIRVCSDPKLPERYFIGPDMAERFARGLLSLEHNWHGPLLTNTGVDATLAEFQEMERRASVRQKLNWRFQQAVYRAYYDAYLRARLVDRASLLQDLQLLPVGSCRNRRRTTRVRLLGVRLCRVRLPRSAPRRCRTICARPRRARGPGLPSDRATSQEPLQLSVRPRGAARSSATQSVP